MIVRDNAVGSRYKAPLLETGDTKHEAIRKATNTYNKDPSHVVKRCSGLKARTYVRKCMYVATAVFAGLTYVLPGSGYCSRTDKNNSGENLANIVATALQRFHISDKVITITADNASNNDNLHRYLHQKLSQSYDNYLTEAIIREGTMKFTQN